MKAGLNLYSIRNCLKTEESYLQTMKDLAVMGYSYVQFSGRELDADLIRRGTEVSGLPVVLTHVPMERIIGDTDTLMAEHESFGCHNIGLGMMPLDILLDFDRSQQTLMELEKVAAYMEQRGFQFFYHHHQFEFFRQNGSSLFDRIVELAPHIHLTLDTYWLQYAGADVCDVIDRLAGRVECMHLKDYQIILKEGDKPKFEPIFAPVGEGNMNFAKIVEHARAAGTQYFLVEQDNAAVLSDGMEQVARSIRYIQNHL